MGSEKRVDGKTLSGPDSIRWVWAYDEGGHRITTAEAVGFTSCSDCGGLHQVRRVTLDMLPGRRPEEAAGQATSEFYPDA